MSTIEPTTIKTKSNFIQLKFSGKGKEWPLLILICNMGSKWTERNRKFLYAVSIGKDSKKYVLGAWMTEFFWSMLNLYIDRDHYIIVCTEGHYLSVGEGREESIINSQSLFNLTPSIFTTDSYPMDSSLCFPLPIKDLNSLPRRSMPFREFWLNRNMSLRKVILWYCSRLFLRVNLCGWEIKRKRL